MDIKTVPHRPYSPDLAPCDFWLFPKLRGCRYEKIEERGCDEGYWHTHTRGLPWGLPEVVGTVQVHCSWRLLRRGLEFHVCTINKSSHKKKKVWKLIVYTSYVRVYIYIYIYIGTYLWVCSMWHNVTFWTEYIFTQFSFTYIGCLAKAKEPSLS